MRVVRTAAAKMKQQMLKALKARTRLLVWAAAIAALSVGIGLPLMVQNAAAAGPTNLASITSTSAGTAPASYADVPDLSATVNVTDTDSVVLLIANIPCVLDSDHSTAEFRFADGGVREGPEMTLCFSHGDNKGSGG